MFDHNIRALTRNLLILYHNFPRLRHPFLHVCRVGELSGQMHRNPVFLPGVRSRRPGRPPRCAGTAAPRQRMRPFNLAGGQSPSGFKEITARNNRKPGPPFAFPDAAANIRASPAVFGADRSQSPKRLHLSDKIAFFLFYLLGIGGLPGIECGVIGHHSAYQIPYRPNVLSARRDFSCIGTSASNLAAPSVPVTTTHPAIRASRGIRSLPG